MLIDSKIYQEIETLLKLELSRVQHSLPSEDIQEIEHYLKHAEIEMAFESLGLSLMQNKIYLTPEARETLLELGLRLNLDNESIFDDEFWIVFNNYLDHDC